MLSFCRRVLLPSVLVGIVSGITFIGLVGFPLQAAKPEIVLAVWRLAAVITLITFIVIVVLLTVYWHKGKGHIS